MNMLAFEMVKRLDEEVIYTKFLIVTPLWKNSMAAMFKGAIAEDLADGYSSETSTAGVAPPGASVLLNPGVAPTMTVSNSINDMLLSFCTHPPRLLSPRTCLLRLKRKPTWHSVLCSFGEQEDTC